MPLYLKFPLCNLLHYSAELKKKGHTMFIISLETNQKKTEHMQ